MPKGYWIVRMDVADAEAYKPYVAANAAPFAAFGARFLVRGGTSEVVEGTGRSRNVVIEFPSYQAALDCYRSPAYQAAKALRLPVSTGDIVVIEGYEGAQPDEPPARGASSYRTPSDIHPTLAYADATTAIAWLCRVFGFEERLVVPGAAGRVEHSELSFGTGVVMVGSSKQAFKRLAPGEPGGAPMLMSVYVDDPDAHHARAVAGGARVVQPLHTAEYGARGYMAEDLEGHLWYFGNYRPGEFWTSAPGAPR